MRHDSPLLLLLLLFYGMAESQAKFYRKLWERMESEKGILAYLQAQVRTRLVYQCLLVFEKSTKQSTLFFRCASCF